ncbi:MAG: hydrogenase nickel incorporation protein HypB [Desulfobacterales bacterium]
MDEIRLIEVKEDILADNKKVGDNVRKRLAEHNAFMVNLMASPGAGKTCLILKTIEALRDELSIAVIEADIDSKVDSEKVAAQGIAAIQLRTGGFCHVDASMVAKGLEALDLDKFDLIIIENVGNLVCPAEVDTGANMDAMILSIPEGHDKPLKYPTMFAAVDVVVVNKMDFLELTDFDMAAMKSSVQALNKGVPIFEVSSRTGDGIQAWAKFVRNRVAEYQASLRQ